MLVVDHLIGLTSPTAALRRAIRLNERGRVAESFGLLTHAAKAGIVDAEYRVAKSYLEGTGVPPSRAEGARWLRRAASHGCVDAQALLSALYVHGLVKAAATIRWTRASGRSLVRQRSPGRDIGISGQ